jgi:hypothetical protein
MFRSKIAELIENITALRGHSADAYRQSLPPRACDRILSFTVRERRFASVTQVNEVFRKMTSCYELGFAGEGHRSYLADTLATDRGGKILRLGSIAHAWTEDEVEAWLAGRRTWERKASE